MPDVSSIQPGTKEVARGASPWFLPGVLLLLWLTAVVAVTANHVPWRDEVVPLTLAEQTANPLGLFQALQIDAGHPVLWYALLHLAYHLFGSPVVLKVVSVAVAFLAAATFLFRAPFPIWFRGLFLFCGLPFFEYSVMARNYGICMLLLFAFAWAYTSNRKNFVLLGLILFLLANTNALAIGFVGLLLAIAVWDGIQSKPKRLAAAVALGLAISGILLSAFTVVRYSGDSVYRASDERSRPELIYDSVTHAGFEFRTVTGTTSLFARFPAGTSSKGLAVTYLFTDLVLLLAIAGLAGRPVLLAAAVAGTWGLSLFFTAVYPGSYRHQGLWLVFVLTLYWLAEARSNPASWPKITQPLRVLSLYLVLPLLFLVNCLHGAHAALDDWRRPASSSRQLGALLSTSEDLRRAVVISQPDLMLDALPYYVPNRLYLMGLSRYGSVASGNHNQKLALSLGDVLLTAHRLHSETGNPIVILMYPTLDRPNADLRYPYGFRFTWNETELAQLRREASHLASLRAATTDENYDVFLIR